MKIVDTLIVNLSDMHSGGSTALFPPRTFGDENQNHTPTPRQLRIYDVFKECMEYAREHRRGKRLIVVHDGDAIEGLHHNSIQVSLNSVKTQGRAHIELMDEFLNVARFDKKRGDLLYYVRGTETHTGDEENKIAADLGAERAGDDLYVWDHLELMVNGRRLWYLHHGKKRGEGANEGNALRNWLRDIFWNCKKLDIFPPDVVFSGHTHAHTYTPFSGRLADGNFHLIHGIILPSWQEKTRYAWKAAAISKNEIGAAFLDISAPGDIRVPRFVIKETEPIETVKV